MPNSKTRYVGPRTQERYVGTVGSAYIDGRWQTAIVNSIRRNHGRFKLSVQLPDASVTEVTLNLWRESGSLTP